MKSLSKNEKSKYLLIAFLGTIITFGIYWAQEVYSNVVTFSIYGDGDGLCFASFMKIREIIMNHEKMVGVDSGSFNASTEFFLRSNIPVIYFPFLLFAKIATFFDPKTIYIFFYALHLTAALYYMLVLCAKYFEFDISNLLIVVSMYLYLLCLEGWYVSFFIVTALVSMVFYCLLEAYYIRSIKCILTGALSLCLISTSGYVTLSCFSVVVVFSFSIIFIFGKEHFSIRSLFRIILPFLIAGSIILLYYLQVFSYISETVEGDTNLSDVIAMRFHFSDIFSVISSFSFYSNSGTENIPALSIGIITTVLLFLSFKDSSINRISKEKKNFVIFAMGGWILFLIWSAENATPVTSWMYTFLPVFGGMHIPNRYMMLIQPFFYIALVILIRELRCDRYKKSFRILRYVLLGLMSIYLIAIRLGASVPFINEDGFIQEVLLSVAFFWLLSLDESEIYNKKPHRIAVFIWMMCFVLPGITTFNNVNHVYEPLISVDNHSVIYNEDAIEAIDEYISENSEGKNMYRFLAYDSQESVPAYLLPNYEWYNYSDYSLCNYSGYEIHLATPKDYRQLNPYFNNIDWEYAVNTRADFFLTDYNTIYEDGDKLPALIDWEKGVKDIGNGRIMVTLYKFVPSTICGTEFVYEDRDSLDNGYFYSHDLENRDITDFKTDENSFYEISVSASKPSVILFLPYPNRFYEYWIDGEKQQAPEIVNMQSVIRIDSGNHTIRVEYNNILGEVGFYFVLFGEGLLVILIAIISLFSTLRKSTNYEKC